MWPDFDDSLAEIDRPLGFWGYLGLIASLAILIAGVGAALGMVEIYAEPAPYTQE